MLKTSLFFWFKKYVRIPYVIFKHSVLDTIRQDGIEHAGYLAFLSILSLFPFLIFLVSILTFLGDSETGAKTIVFLLSSAPPDIASALSPRIEEILNGPPQSLLTIAIIGIIWTASSAVEGIRTILNRAYRIFSPPPYIWRRLLSIFQFFMITISITAAMVLLVIFPALLKKIELVLTTNFRIDYDWMRLREVVIFLILFISTALLYYIIPNAEQRFIHTLPGAFVCVILFPHVFLSGLFCSSLFSFLRPGEGCSGCVLVEIKGFWSIRAWSEAGSSIIAVARAGSSATGGPGPDGDVIFMVPPA